MGFLAASAIGQYEGVTYRPGCKLRSKDARKEGFRIAPAVIGLPDLKGLGRFRERFSLDASVAKTVRSGMTQWKSRRHAIKHAAAGAACFMAAWFS
jgi:hypothetical protein